jgi:molybdate transport system regulatory protein
LHSTNEGFTEPVVELSVGGKDGGGTRLTAFGRQLIADYRQFDAQVDELAARLFANVRVSGRAPEPEERSRRPVNRPLAPNLSTRTKRKTG